MRAVISRRRWRRLQLRERRWKQYGATNPRMHRTSRTLRNLTLGLDGRRRRSVRRGRRSSSSRLQRTPSTVHNGLPTWRWFTRGQASATERSSNSKLSRRSQDLRSCFYTWGCCCRHTAISASIRAGILCAVTSASTRSLPQPKLPTDNSSVIKTDRSAADKDRRHYTSQLLIAPFGLRRHWHAPTSTRESTFQQFVPAAFRRRFRWDDYNCEQSALVLTRGIKDK